MPAALQRNARPAAASPTGSLRAWSGPGVGQAKPGWLGTGWVAILRCLKAAPPSDLQICGARVYNCYRHSVEIILMPIRLALLSVIVFLSPEVGVAQAPQSSVYQAGTDVPATQGPATQQAGSAGQLGQPVTAASRPTGPPFQLSEVEQQFVLQLLEMWETESAKIKTFNADFERLDYNVFGAADQPMIRSFGQVTYSKPDKGSFKINEIHRWKQDRWEHQKQELGDHWVCDGKAVYQYVHREKILEVTPLPAELRGQSIVDGPLPFLFGAEAEKLLSRYWIRPKQGNPEMIWLEAYPRRQADALNYSRVEIMLDRKTMTPTAMQTHAPNGQSRAVYKFTSPVVNGKLDALFGGLFNAPRTPIGYKRVVREAPAGSPQAAAPAAARR